jgi:lipopolysaccharide export LptBFGC system permease protein LptF
MKFRLDLPVLGKRLHRLFPAPLGMHTRHMFAAYLRNSFFVLSAMLVVALSMDLSVYLGRILSVTQGDNVIFQVLYVGWYIAMRSTDQVTEWLPLGCFIGVCWAEIRHTTSRERLSVQLSGRAPTQCLVPLIIFALFAGALEYTLIVYLRPAAVTKQVAAHLGLYGAIFNRDSTPQRVWIAAENGLIHARVDYSSPPVLRDVQLFQVDHNQQLSGIIVAASATPTGNGNSWSFKDGRHAYVKSNSADKSGPAESSEHSLVPVNSSFHSETIELGVNQFWLRYLGISAKYLPNNVFELLGRTDFLPSNEYKTWNQARYSIPITAAGMVLMVGTLAQLLFVNRIGFRALLFVLFSGYAANFLTKLLLVLGNHDWVRPVIAAWIVPLLVITCPCAVYYWIRVAKRSSSVIPTLIM